MCDQIISEYLPFRPGKLKPVHPSISYYPSPRVSLRARGKGRGRTHEVGDLLGPVVPVYFGRVEGLGIVCSGFVVQDCVCGRAKRGRVREAGGAEGAEG